MYTSNEGTCRILDSGGLHVWHWRGISPGPPSSLYADSILVTEVSPLLPLKHPKRGVSRCRQPPTLSRISGDHPHGRFRGTFDCKVLESPTISSILNPPLREEISFKRSERETDLLIITAFLGPADDGLLILAREVVDSVSLFVRDNLSLSMMCDEGGVWRSVERGCPFPFYIIPLSTHDLGDYDDMSDVFTDAPKGGIHWEVLASLLGAVSDGGEVPLG